MKTIVTLTINPAIDKSTSVEHVVAERKLRCNTPRHRPGGGGINVSRAIHNLGGDSLALYPAGGTVGKRLRDLLDEEGIKHQWTAIQDTTRENLMVLDEATNVQYRFGMPGAQMHETEWRQLLDELPLISPRPDYIVASGSLPPGVPDDFYVRAAGVAKDLGARFIVDTSGEALRAIVQAGGAYLLKPNMREIAELAGHQIRDDPDLEQATMDIVKQGQAEVLVVSIGAAGALLVSKDGHRRLHAPPVPIKSKIGAGDSMVAGIVLSLARGKPLLDAVRFGVAAGSAAVMVTELCSKEDTERLYQQMSAEKA
ncbi:MAG: 1-phosphofructokinase family hexose kinase [Dehalococcoidia bacterium]|nr:1-phosphofructokinase family hexose kinase [Dehalococcoidia bacterium]